MIDPNWNKTVLSITILLSLVLSIFVLTDPVATSKLLSGIYTNLSSKFESLFMYGSFVLLILLFLLAISKYGKICSPDSQENWTKNRQNIFGQ